MRIGLTRAQVNAIRNPRLSQGIEIKYTGGGPASIQQVNVLRVVTAVAAACITSEVPGLLKLRIARWLTAAGALAVFAAVFFWWR